MFEAPPHMGAIIQAKLREIFGGNTKQDITILGLDNAGKTSILYLMKHGHEIATIPTIGFNVESFSVNGTVFNSWDIGGQDEIRALWEPYIETAAGIVYVIDIVDVQRWDLAAEELRNICLKPNNLHKPVLILANKTDVIGFSNSDSKCAELDESLQLRNSGVNYKIFPVCAVSRDKSLQLNDRLIPAFDWLSQALKTKNRQNA